MSFPVMLKLISTMLVISSVVIVVHSFQALGRTKLRGMALTLLAVLIMLLSILWANDNQYLPENQTLMLMPSGLGGPNCIRTWNIFA